ncbi:MAG: ABC transporter ATP-binding protein [Bacteroidetes bacterium]|nr:ABC transporter ATP-binding protein [Bacteroidota bacterium]MBS1757537.1 ABC transporter ATP-binding protein [Bacteroidota bacterium]
MTQLSTLNKYFWKYKWYFFLGILFVVLTNYFRILAPQITGYVVNTVVSSISTSGNHIAASQSAKNYDVIVRAVVTSFDTLSFNKKILFAGIILLLLAVISGIFMFLMRQTIIVMSRHIEFAQKNEIFAHYQKLDTAFYKLHSTGDLMNRISEDVSRVRMYTGPALMYFINLAAVIGFSIFFMFKSDVKLTIVALCPLPILAFTIYFVNTIINKKSERIQSLLSDLTTNAQESYSGIRVIKSFVQEQAMLRFFKNNSESYRANALSLAKTEAVYFPSMALLIGLSTLLTILVGALDVVHHPGNPEYSVGKIAEFVLYIQMLTFPVSAIGWTASMTQRAVASQRRINEFLLINPAIKNKTAAVVQKLTGNISFKDVNFIYPNTGIHAVKNFTLQINKGDKIAIVGRTGSGKTTIAQLLLRMYDAQQGQLLYDGIAVQDLKLENLRGQISYVPQDVFLFSDSIKNNILFGNAGATFKEVEEAASAANIYKEISEFEDKFETMVGERGVTLSGGQKQRISIARALIKKPEIVIFDDCLSAVDARTEKTIITNLYQYLQKRTAIIITHRIFSLFNFDKIIVMEEGQIAEMGNHQQLMQLNGLYAEMYQKQQQSDEGLI